MANFTLKANKREITGRKVKALRRQGIIPGNVFGASMKSLSVEFDEKELTKVIKAAGETSLVELSIKDQKESYPVLVAGYHTNPVTGALLHVDLHRVNLKEKTTASVPVHTIGESKAVEEGNILVLLRNEIEVEALPTDLPESLEVDISALAAVGDTVHAKDLKVDRTKVSLLIEDEEPVVTIQEPAKEEVVEVKEEEGSGEEEAKEEKGETESKEGEVTDTKAE